MATELFRVPLEEASKRDFTLTDQQLAGYNPSIWFTSTELLDTVPEIEDWPTEDDLEVLTNGIPISHLPKLGRWPSGPEATASSSQNAAPSESFAPAPTA